MIKLIKTITESIQHWYLPMIIGLLFMALGVYIFTVPLETYITLSFAFSISFIIAGLIEAFFSISNHKSIDGWGWYLVGGLINLIVGILLLSNPNVSIAILPFYVAFTLLFKSIQGLGISFDMKTYGILSWGNVAITSIIGILCSILLLNFPIFTGLSLTIFTALAFISVGISSVIVSLNLKKLKDIPQTMSSELSSKIEEIKQLLK